MLRELLMMMGRTAGMPILLPDYKSPLITYAQSGNLTYFDSAGVLQTAAVNTMVLDYNPLTLALRGYPFWEARVNSLLWNRDLTNAAWVKVTMTTAKTATGIDGVANSASTITAAGALSTILQTVVSASAARATTAYVKRRTGTGTVEMTQDGVTWTDITASINSSTWSRVGPATATVTNPIVGFRITTSGDAIDVDYGGLENGAFPTAAILVTTVAVTRAAPSCAITGANFTSFFNAIEGTYQIKWISGGTPALAFLIQARKDGTGSDSIGIRYGSALGGTPASNDMFVRAGSVTQVDTGGPNIAVGTTYTTCAAYKLNNCAIVTNNGTVFTDLVCTMPTGVAIQDIGMDAGGSVFSGWINSLSYYPSRLPDATLQSLST